MTLAGPTPYAVDTTKAIKFLEAQDHRNIITYTSLSDGMGFDVQEHRWNLNAAIRYMERMHGRHFIIIRNVGLKEAEANESAAFIDSGRRGIGRRARRLVKTAATIDVSGMEGTEIQSLAANAYLLHHMAKDAHHEGHKRITSRLRSDMKELPTASQIAKMMNGEAT